MSPFEERFGYPPETTEAAPGRVNMLGEHTDYNDGFVLPTIIPQTTRVFLAESRDAVDRVVSAQLGLGESGGFKRYISGCLAVLRHAGHPVCAVSIYIDSDVPIGAGLSSSAALEVATLRALRSRFDLPIDDVTIARLAQRAEIEYAGVNCGIMDQMAASVGARLTGAGFGGACVALVRPGTQSLVATDALAKYAASGHVGRRLV